MAAAADRRVPRASQERRGRPEQRRAARRRRHHGRAVPQGVRRRDVRGRTWTSPAPPSSRRTGRWRPKGATGVRGAHDPDLSGRRVADGRRRRRPALAHDRVRRRPGAARAGAAGRAPRRPRAGGDRPRLARTALAEALDEARGLRGARRSSPASRSTATWRAARSTSSATASTGEAAWFQEFLREQRAERAARVHRIAERLAELGMPIDRRRGLRHRARRARRAGRTSPRSMVDRGYVKSVREAFDRYLHAGRPGQRAAPAAHARRGGRRSSGARGRRAGPRASRARRQRDEMIPELVDGGPHGHRGATIPSTRPRRSTAYLELCRRLGLVATGGSDFHGPQHRRRLNPARQRPTCPHRRSWDGARGEAPWRSRDARRDRPDLRLHGLPDTRKAQRFFAERRIAVHFVDLAERPASPGRAAALPESFGAAALIDREGPRFRALGLRVAGDSPERLLERALTEPRLLRTPLVRIGGKRDGRPRARRLAGVGGRGRETRA